ncbi:MAG: hypothetical protein ACOYM2_01655 [Rectinemataceae bacterium]
MKKLALSMTCAVLAMVLAAQEAGGDMGELEKENQGLRTELEMLQSWKESALWENGWGVEASLGDAYGGIQGQAGVFSPKFARLIKVGLHGLVQFDKASRAADLLKATVRTTLSTPLFFSSTRIYGGVEGVLSDFLPNEYHPESRYGINIGSIAGFEVHLGGGVSIFGQVSGPIDARLSWGQISIYPLSEFGLRYYFGN